ncbi:hypothetical protein [Aquimarina sp. MMG016]|uniref:hypothetical protein n=1 Tax=Aquimarina sp. MMG016 TaxID=2822690 RepID=UPI001B3A2636|nr:hypothetical protein [Aquimarina sp. MMG016]MBQ4822750.1 hypothetical protein [Aquimarina sp. MMG016]
MRKSMLKIEGIQKLSKNSQSKINGGATLSDCPRGCFSPYLSDINGTFCAIPSPSGAVCFGTIRNDKCCL